MNKKTKLSLDSMDSVTKEKIRKQTVRTGKQNLNLTPFEDLVHLQSIVSYERRGRKVGAYLLKKSSKDLFCFTFGFETQGIHTTMSADEINPLFDQLDAGLKDLPFGESLTLHLKVERSCRSREEHLDNLIALTDYDELKFLLWAEKARIKQLSQEGLREPKKLYIFATYHERVYGDRPNADWIEKWMASLEHFWYKLKGKEIKHRRTALHALLRQAFSDGFLAWEQFLAAKLGLRVKAMSADSLWEYLWYKFNESLPIPLPQKLILDDKGVREEINSNVHLTTLMLRESVPIFDRQWVHLNGRYLGVLTFWDKPGGWKDKQSELKYLWNIVAHIRQPHR